MKSEPMNIMSKLLVAGIALLVLAGLAFFESRGSFELFSMAPKAARLVATPAFTSSLDEALRGSGSVVCDIREDEEFGLRAPLTVSVLDGAIRVDEGFEKDKDHVLVLDRLAFRWHDHASTGDVRYVHDTITSSLGTLTDLVALLRRNETLCSAVAVSPELFTLPYGVAFPDIAPNEAVL